MYPHPPSIGLGRKHREAESDTQAREGEGESRLVPCAITVVALAPTRAGVTQPGEGHGQSEVTSMGNRLAGEVLPCSCQFKLISTLGAVPSPLSCLWVHVPILPQSQKLFKASDLAVNPTRVVHFHRDLNFGGRKLSALPWQVRVQTNGKGQGRERQGINLL